jgi:hypothetical protein
MTKLVFFHRASRTFVLSDLIDSFEPQKLHSLLLRWLTRLGGVQHSNGKTPLDLQMTFAKHKPHLRRTIEKVISWQPERVIFAHGRWYKSRSDVLKAETTALKLRRLPLKSVLRSAALVHASPPTY